MRFLGLFVVVACLTCSVSGCDKSTPLQAKKLTHAEFEALVVGKPAGEVVKAVGKPDKVQKTNAVEYWYYDGAAIDPSTKRAGRAALVFGRDASGPCQMVRWN